MHGPQRRRLSRALTSSGSIEDMAGATENYRSFTEVVLMLLLVVLCLILML